MGGTILAIFFVILAVLALIIAGCVWVFDSFSTMIADMASTIIGTSVSSEIIGAGLFAVVVGSLGIACAIKMYRKFNNFF